jgi:hypothetical protein
MSSNFPELVFTETEDFTADRLNKAMQVLDQRLRSLEPFSPSWEAAVNELRTFGLSRLNDAIVPTLESVQQLAELGFLIADSNTSVTLTQDADVTFIINSGPKRDLFKPTPFLVATRDANVSDYATLRLKSYDKATGELLVTVKTIAGHAGPFEDWWIGPLAGNALASQNYFTQIQAAKDAVLAAKAIVIANSAQTQIDLATSASTLTAINAAKEVALQAAANAALWDPTNYALKSYVDGRISNLINGSGTALDTLKELADALGNDSSFSATITASLGNRIRFDAAQTLTGPQQVQAQANIGLPRATSAQISNNSADNVVTVQQAWAAAGFYNIGDSGSGTLSVDCNNGSRQYARLTGNVAVNFVNPKDGGVIELVLYQDATGGRTVSWNSSIKWPDGFAPQITTGANQIAVVLSGMYFPAYGYMLAAAWKIA